ncbi:hypothetical protein [Nocardioides bizhenqiangii]|uniref:Septum formation initiator n=1 Tax=Nocardioides bizhenqiangii TaxID=3095076 RepID=A0ABZ0ZU29_9ACTN|nr:MULTISPECIES: hypothetical protein [unclassified Nocardioides]MDZ5621729.1 hypothetical protein [Nocardioides sp. HM23]WQQ27585.1 hypothetical protein SHK19_04965 [Nocardioides sp. HM61]
MKRRWLITAPLAWVGVVAVVALVAWWVIDDAGESVLTQPAREVITPTPDASDTTAPDPSASGSARPQPSASATDGPTTAPPPDTSAPPPTTAESTAGSPEQPAPVRRTSTWQGEEGLLRVSCTGHDLQLEGATPQDGYEIDKNERRSGSELEVRFRSIDGDRRVEIEARCVNGVPAFAVERDD